MTLIFDLGSISGSITTSLVTIDSLLLERRVPGPVCPARGEIDSSEEEGLVDTGQTSASHSIMAALALPSPCLGQAEPGPGLPACLPERQEEQGDRMAPMPSSLPYIIPPVTSCSLVSPG